MSSPLFFCQSLSPLPLFPVARLFCRVFELFYFPGKGNNFLPTPCMCPLKTFQRHDLTAADLNWKPLLFFSGSLHGCCTLAWDAEIKCQAFCLTNLLLLNSSCTLTNWIILLRNTLVPYYILRVNWKCLTNIISFSSWLIRYHLFKLKSQPLPHLSNKTSTLKAKKHNIFASKAKYTLCLPQHMGCVTAFRNFVNELPLLIILTTNISSSFSLILNLLQNWIICPDREIQLSSLFMLSLPCFALIQFQNPFLSSIRRSRLLNGAAHMDDNMCFITHESRSPPKKIWRWEMETWWTSLFLFLLKWQFQFYCSLIAPHAQSGCPINCNHSSRHLSMSLTVGYVALPCLMFHYSPPPHPFVIWYSPSFTTIRYSICTLFVSLWFAIESATRYSSYLSNANRTQLRSTPQYQQFNRSLKAKKTGEFEFANLFRFY